MKDKDSNIPAIGTLNAATIGKRDGKGFLSGVAADVAFTAVVSDRENIVCKVTISLIKVRKILVFKNNHYGG